MHFAPTQSFVVQVVEAGVGEGRVECPQVCQIKWKVGSVVDAGEKAHESARLARGRILTYRALDDAQRAHRVLCDRRDLTLQRVQAHTLSRNDLLPGELMFVALTFKDGQLDLNAPFSRRGDGHVNTHESATPLNGTSSQPTALWITTSRHDGNDINWLFCKLISVIPH